VILSRLLLPLGLYFDGLEKMLAIFANDNYSQDASISTWVLSIEGVCMIVCICRAVSDKTIHNAIENGAESIQEIGATCRAGTSCGACVPNMQRMIEEKKRRISSGCSGRAFAAISSPYLMTTGDMI
jgi:bacterioferritin-associated ferredoxin